MIGLYYVHTLVSQASRWDLALTKVELLASGRKRIAQKRSSLYSFTKVAVRPLFRSFKRGRVDFWALLVELKLDLATISVEQVKE